MLSCTMQEKITGRVHLRGTDEDLGREPSLKCRLRERKAQACLERALKPADALCCWLRGSGHGAREEM